MDRRIEIFIPHFVVGFALAFYVTKGSMESVYAFAIASVFWLTSMLVPRLFPYEKPTKLAADIESLEKTVAELSKVVQQNAEFSAKEFGTLKNVLQIKQMGML